MAIILAVDTSDRCAHLALRLDNKEFSRSAGQDRSVEQLPQLLKAVLDESGIMLGQVELLAAALGPGSFTGIRAGLAFAIGIADALAIPLYGISTLLARGHYLQHDGREDAPAAPRSFSTTASARELFCGEYQHDEAAGLVPLGELRNELVGTAAINLDSIPPAIAIARFLSSCLPLFEGYDRGLLATTYGVQVQRYPEQALSPIYVKPLTAKTLKERGLASSRTSENN